jgi:hypothetical protein
MARGKEYLFGSDVVKQMAYIAAFVAVWAAAASTVAPFLVGKRVRDRCRKASGKDKERERLNKKIDETPVNPEDQEPVSDPNTERPYETFG